jgi:hypothetical protein
MKPNYFKAKQHVLLMPILWGDEHDPPIVNVSRATNRALRELGRDKPVVSDCLAALNDILYYVPKVRSQDVEGYQERDRLLDRMRAVTSVVEQYKQSGIKAYSVQMRKAEELIRSALYPRMRSL